MPEMRAVRPLDELELTNEQGLDHRQSCIFAPLSSGSVVRIHGNHRSGEESCELRQRCVCPDYEQAAGTAVQAELTRETMLLVVNGLAPCCLTDALVLPQLVTPMTTFGFAALPAVVPVNAGRTPKLASSGPPLDPPHMSEP